MSNAFASKFQLTPQTLILSYLLSLPLLKLLSPLIPNPKSLLLETMVLYNATQVLLNGWTVYYILHALYNGHPIVGDVKATTCSLAVWVHYADKYLEFFDTYFMLLRGNFSQGEEFGGGRGRGGFLRHYEMKIHTRNISEEELYATTC